MMSCAVMVALAESLTPRVTIATTAGGGAHDDAHHELHRIEPRVRIVLQFLQARDGAYHLPHRAKQRPERQYRKPLDCIHVDLLCRKRRNERVTHPTFCL
jgi:hypothetical protein